MRKQICILSDAGYSLKVCRFASAPFIGQWVGTWPSLYWGLIGQCRTVQREGMSLPREPWCQLIILGTTSKNPVSNFEPELRHHHLNLWSLSLTQAITIAISSSQTRILPNFLHYYYNITDFHCVQSISVINNDVILKYTKEYCNNVFSLQD